MKIYTDKSFKGIPCLTDLGKRFQEMDEFEDYAWWFPEKEADQLYGWRESNINILTDDTPPYNRELGSTNLRGILCKVYKES